MHGRQPESQLAKYITCKAKRIKNESKMNQKMYQ